MAILTVLWQYADNHATFAAAGAVHQAMIRPSQYVGSRLGCSWPCGQSVCLVICMVLAGGPAFVMRLLAAYMR